MKVSKVVRWSPFAYYCFSVAWGTFVAGSVELPDLLVYTGVISAYLLLGVAAEQMVIA